MAVTSGLLACSDPSSKARVPTENSTAAPTNAAPSSSGGGTATPNASMTASDGASSTTATTVQTATPSAVAPTVAATDGTRSDAVGSSSGTVLTSEFATETSGRTPTGVPSSSATSGPNAETSVGSMFPPGVITPRIMIVGDSISAGPGCYKGLLAQQLADNGFSVEFVGKYDDACGSGVKHGAVSCSTTADYVKETFVLANASCAQTPFDGLASLCAEFRPDLIMLQLGVNDVWGPDVSIQPVLDNYTTLVEQARGHNPNIVVVVAQIHKINTQQTSTPCTVNDFSPKAQELVDAVPAWAMATTSLASPVFVADLWTDSVVSETNDCVHPNAAGDQKMANAWYRTLSSILR